MQLHDAPCIASICRTNTPPRPIIAQPCMRRTHCHGLHGPSLIQHAHRMPAPHFPSARCTCSGGSTLSPLSSLAGLAPSSPLFCRTTQAPQMPRHSQLSNSKQHAGISAYKQQCQRGQCRAHQHLSYHNPLPSTQPSLPPLHTTSKASIVHDRHSDLLQHC